MNKKLIRRNGYIGGVCQGLGEWSGIPSILWRVGFLFFYTCSFLGIRCIVDDPKKELLKSFQNQYR